MKVTSILFASLLTFVNTQGRAAEKLPASLDCVATKSFDESGKEIATSDLTFRLRKLDTDKPRYSGETGVIEQEKDSVVVDFGVRAHGGDQFLSFTFTNKDIQNFNNKKTDQLSGVHEEGYDWADGLHVTKDFIECL